MVQDQFYLGYMLRKYRGAKPFCVFENSCFLYPLYRAETLNEAKRWVRAYRDGAVWAVLEKLNAAEAA